jgi:hypothetical protein
MIVELFGSYSPSELHSAIEALIAELHTDTSTQKLALYLSQKLDDLKQLLVHFITAQYADQDAREIGQQIESVSQAMTQEIQHFATVRGSLREIQGDPSKWNSGTLSTLEHYKTLLTQRPF